MFPSNVVAGLMRVGRWMAIAFCGVVLVWLLHTGMLLLEGRSRPVDTFLVLGGSIRREIYAADLARTHPDARFLISKGSDDPCIRIIFERSQTSLSNVWLEKCANSTFENFYFSLPVLTEWSSHHVHLVTSSSHVPRALWLARIILGAHGIWVEPDLVEEQGIPGNQESWLKTALDVMRGVLWAGISQFYAPACDDVIPLQQVDLAAWRAMGFECEHQAGIDES